MTDHLRDDERTVPTPTGPVWLSFEVGEHIALLRSRLTEARQQLAEERAHSDALADAALMHSADCPACRALLTTHADRKAKR